MACSNPIAINNSKVNDFGFTTVFNPYNKTVKFDISSLSSFVSIGGVIAAFQITDPQGNVVGDLAYNVDAQAINVGASATTVTIALPSTGILFYGTYEIKARIWSTNAISHDIEFEVVVCHDNRLETRNFIEGCITVDTNCSTAKMVIKEQTNLKYNGLTPVSKTSSNTITYPDNYLAQKTFTTIPYSLDLNGSITGLYQVKTNTTARYELVQCHCFIDVLYISQWADNVSCSAALATLLCCWTESLEIAQKGGVVGRQMQDKIDESSAVFKKALLQEMGGVNSEKTVKQLQEMLGCDCGCKKGLTIQANPITFGDKNIVQGCGVSVTEVDGEITISSFNVVLATCNNTDGFEFNLSVDGCNKVWCLTVDFSVFAQNIIEAIEGDDAAIVYWQNVLGINSCPCKSNVLWLSQNGLPPDVSNPLTYSQITVCGGSVITFPTPQVADSLADVVTYLNTHILVTAGVFSYVVSGGSNLFSLTTDLTGIKSSYIPTDGSCVFQIYLYNSCATVVYVNDTPLIMSVERLGAYYAVLSSQYFTKSDTVVSIKLKDQTTITGGSLGTISITESTSGGSALISATEAEYDLSTSNQCGSLLISKTGVLAQNILTSGGCTSLKQCQTSYERVPYSERLSFMYRNNPQINDLPYYGDNIYFSDSSNRGASAIRIYNTVTNEVIHIAGNILPSSPAITVNNVWGDAVFYNYASALYVDKNDISNGFPTIYFITYGGVVCKIVRERSTECDERANWKNYIIAGSNVASVVAVPQTGTNARFSRPYGLKRFGTINGVPSFIVFNTGALRLDFLYYKIASGTNDSANWYVDSFGITSFFDGNGNINVDFEPSVLIGDTTYTNVPTVYLFGAGVISKYYYTGSLTNLAALANPVNYTAVSIISQALGSVDGLGSTIARVHMPISLSKITYNGITTYVFSEEYNGGGIPVGSQKLRGFYATSSPAVDPTGFTFITIVPDNNKIYSTFGFANSGSGTPTANGATQGIFYHPTKNKYFELSIQGGIRKFCPNLNVTQATIFYENETGAESAIATAQDLTQIVDTNYRLKITCASE